jgi:hypothetical protein
MYLYIIKVTIGEDWNFNKSRWKSDGEGGDFVSQCETICLLKHRLLR